MNSFGERIRKLRDEKGTPLRIVAFHLGVDQAILSKIENGKRKATKKQVELISDYFNVPIKELLIDWLSDKIVYEIVDEEFGVEALKVAEQKVNYQKKM
ncbi:MAG: helix-turn-helix transcriptional regulator [Bacteroidetes bacterium]|nr:helix-turn-helix transcriptional regulator [Bacteroidota bacterium]